MSADSSERLEEERLPIFIAAREGKEQRIRSLLQGLPRGQVTDSLHQCICSSFYRRGHVKFTPLSIAAYDGHMRVVRMFVEEYGMNIDQTDDGQCLVTALGGAALGGRFDIVRYLVTCGCDVNVINAEGKTALHFACTQRNLDIAKYLQQNGASLEILDENGYTCLMQTCYNTDYNMAQWLLSCGADVNVKNNRDETALHIAAIKDSGSLAQLFLEHGAAMMENKQGFTPVVLAAIQRSYSAMECFAEWPGVSKEDKIQGLELLGAMTVDMDKAFSYLHRAMKERYRDPNEVVPKTASPLPILSHLQESVSLEELEGRESDHNLLRLECWATIRRIFSVNNPSAWRVYADFLNHQNKETRLKFTISLLLQYEESGNDPSVEIWLVYLEMFLNISMDAFYGDTEPPLEDLLKILAFIVRKLQGYEDDHKARATSASWFDFICRHCVQRCLHQDPDPGKGTLWAELAGNFLCLSSFLRKSQCVLLDAVVIWCEFAELDEAQLHAEALVRFLLVRGADPNRKDINGQTALHRLAEIAEDDENQQRLKIWVSIARMLLKGGALPAVRNRHGFNALALAGSSPVKDVIREFLPASLQSLAALAVLEHKIAFRSEVSQKLAAFVDLH